MAEHDIQDYIWKNRENWKELINDIVFPQEYRFEEDEFSIYTLSPDKKSSIFLSEDLNICINK